MTDYACDECFDTGTYKTCDHTGAKVWVDCPHCDVAKKREESAAASVRPDLSREAESNSTETTGPDFEAIARELYERFMYILHRHVPAEGDLLIQWVEKTLDEIEQYVPASPLSESQAEVESLRDERDALVVLLKRESVWPVAQVELEGCAATLKASGGDGDECVSCRLAREALS